MPLAKSHGISLFGLSGTVIEVEADISAQLPAFVLVGLPDASLSEATARVRAACGNSGFPFPSRKVVVNLSPAAVPKSGSAFDLPIAVSVLAAMEAIPKSALKGACLIGELGLDGSLRAVPGVLPMAICARKSGFTSLLVPAGNLGEASLVTDMDCLGFDNLKQVIGYLRGEIHTDALPSLSASPSSSGEREENQLGSLDFSQVLGQEVAVEGLIVAAAGGHHLSMIGAPGAGKTMLAERLPSILPPLTPDEALEVAAIESIYGDGQQQLAMNLQRRFQSPHHSSSQASIIGGGSGSPRPGAVSRAHHGVLFLDEALEFHAATLDALREPLEAGQIIINRTAGSAVFPAKFQLVLAANPCPCGFLGVYGKECRCTAMTVRRYGNRISGPVLDRIDIRLSIQPVTLATNLGLSKPYTSSAEARQKVALARDAAADRLKPFGLKLNSEVPGPVLKNRLPASTRAMKELDSLLSASKLSMRGHDRCLRLAWTLADLDGQTSPQLEHVQAAVSLRGSDQLGD